jgi:hypothetical protein
MFAVVIVPQPNKGALPAVRSKYGTLPETVANESLDLWCTSRRPRYGLAA